MSRKTIDIEFLKTFVNSTLQFSPDGNTDYRQGLIDVLEQALHKTKNYAGFVYLDEKEMEITDNAIPGIRRIPGSPSECSWENTDRTRIRYF